MAIIFPSANSIFTVDSIPPKLETTTPGNNYVNVPITQVIKLGFTEPIKFSKNSWIELKNSAGIAIPFTSDNKWQYINYNA